jgi:hypothetical protein
VASVHDEYVDVLRDRIGIKSWIPNWRPGADIKLGAVGRIEDGEFTRAYSLKDRGISDDVLKLAEPDTQPDDYDGASDNALSIDIKAAGETDQAFKGVAKASIGVKLSFSRESAVAMVYRGVLQHSFEDERTIGDAMVESWSGGPMPKMKIGDFAITQTMVAGWGFVFGSKSAKTSVLLEFAADAGIPKGAKLGQLKGHFGIVNENDTSFRAYSPGGEEGVVIGYRGLLLTQIGWFFLETVAEPRTTSFLVAENYAADDAAFDSAELVVPLDEAVLAD